MYISCPKCGTKFSVDATKIGNKGKKVRCSKCSHVWHQDQENKLRVSPLLTTNNSEASDKKINLPALLPVKNTSNNYLNTLMAIGMIVLTLLILFHEKLGINKSFGNGKLAIKDIEVNKIEKDKIKVSYKIYNLSQEDQNIPLIRIRVLDENNNILKSKITYHKKIRIPPNQFIRASKEFLVNGKSAENIDIMIGNKLDFMLR